MLRIDDSCMNSQIPVFNADRESEVKSSNIAAIGIDIIRNHDQREFISLKKICHTRSRSQVHSHDNLPLRVLGFDLKTAQTGEAETHAFKVLGYLVSVMSENEGTFFPENHDPYTIFTNLIAALKNVIESADTTDPDDCALLNSLAVQLKINFSGNKSNGGLGALYNRRGNFEWKPEWDGLGSEKKFEPLQMTMDTFIQKLQLPEDKVNEIKKMFVQIKDSDFGKIKISQNIVNELVERGVLDEKDCKKYKLAKVELSANNSELIKNNEKYAESFLSMLNYFSCHSGDTFGSSNARPPLGKALSKVQLTCLIGQLLHDFAFESRMKSNKLLTRALNDNKVINKIIDFTHQEGERAALPELEKAMRESPLLAEVSIYLLTSEITKHLRSIEVNGILSSLIESADIKDEEKQLLQTILESYIKEISKEFMNSNYKTCGSRGRTKENSNAGNSIAGMGGLSHGFAVMPNRSDDKKAIDAVVKALNKEHFLEEIHSDESLGHAESPTRVLRLDSSLDSRVKNFVQNPLNPLISAILSSEIAEETKNKLLQSPFFSENGAGERLKKSVEQLEVTFNSATQQKMNLKDFSQMKTAAAILKEHHLRTICSVSGTTVDALAGILALQGKDRTLATLRPLLDLSEALYSGDGQMIAEAKNNMRTSKNGKEFQILFSSIATFMQAGQYHSAAEVLGGLFIAGRGMASTGNEHRDIKETFAMFNSLMEDFSKHPETYIPASEADRNKIDEAYRLNFKN